MLPLKFLRRVICLLTVPAYLCALEAPPPGYDWHIVSDIVDNTHRHVLYELRYQGRRVVDAYKKEHFSRKGQLELQQSSIDSFRAVSLPRESLQTHWETMYGKTLDYEIGPYEGRIKSEPVVWIDPKTNEPHPAIQLVLNYANSLVPRKIIVEESSGRLLEEKAVVRNASTTTEVWPISPTPVSAYVDPVDRLVDYLDNLTSLKNSNVWVRREEVTSYPPLVSARVDVIPTTDFVNSGSYLDPVETPASLSTYLNSFLLCAGNDGAACPNQGLPAVNVYYHVMGFRKRLDAYFTTLGTSLTFPSEPLNILINPVSLVGVSSANNAMYVDTDCTSGMPRCLLFLRPETLSAASGQANCSDSTVTLYDFAREAVVATHEYQHYVTDTITHIAFNAEGAVSVGDALHEGYSDYLAASYVSDLNSSNETVVGKYALAECSPLRRDLSVLREFTGGEEEEDPHVSGLSWASGLWNLRTQIGMEKADLIALKSLFFLSTSPGYVESIEALVRADQAIYAGANAAVIRDIFYNQVGWGGDLSSVFKDPANGIVEVGVKGCGAVHTSNEGTHSLWATIFLTLSFLFLTIRVGRKARRQ